jgi:hypothetical protein
MGRQHLPLYFGLGGGGEIFKKLYASSLCGLGFLVWTVLLVQEKYLLH